MPLKGHNVYPKCVLLTHDVNPRQRTLGQGVGVVLMFCMPQLLDH